jgi:hypothetical protein
MYIYVNASASGIATRYYRPAANDGVSHCTGVRLLAAGDKVSLVGANQADVRFWGSTGYDGTYVEAEYLFAA